MKAGGRHYADRSRSVFKAARTDNEKLMTLTLLVILGNGCKNAGATISSVTELRLADNIVAGWQEDTARFATFDTATFYELIDGGAPAYIDEGWLMVYPRLFSVQIPLILLIVNLCNGFQLIG